MSFGIQAERGRLTASHADQHDAALMVELYKILHSPEMMADWAEREPDEQSEPTGGR